MVMPFAPNPDKTKVTAKTILQTEPIIMILGNDFVSNDAIRIERRRFTITEIAIRKIEIIINSNSIEWYIRSLKMKIIPLHTNILENEISKEAFIMAFVWLTLPSEKLFPRKRVLPADTPRSMILEKIMLSEIIVDESPITSGVVNFDSKIHKT